MASMWSRIGFKKWMVMIFLCLTIWRMIGMCFNMQLKACSVARPSAWSPANILIAGSDVFLFQFTDYRTIRARIASVERGLGLATDISFTGHALFAHIVIQLGAYSRGVETTVARLRARNWTLNGRLNIRTYKLYVIDLKLLLNIFKIN